jgi:hypothetical protein
MSYPNFNNDLDDDNEGDEAAREAAAIEKASNVKVLVVHGHSVDRNHFRFKDENGRTLFDIEGYVPSSLGIGGGDDIELEIDIKTGQILNWKEISIESLVNIQLDE